MLCKIPKEPGKLSQRWDNLRSYKAQFLFFILQCAELYVTVDIESSTGVINTEAVS